MNHQPCLTCRGMWCRTGLASVVAALLTIPASTAPGATPTADLDFFESRVRPLLVAHCQQCHSAAAGDPEGGLSFDSRADFFAAAGVAVAGRPDESLLVKVVRYDGDLQMPPDGRLPPEAISTIEEWVRRGLPWPEDGKQVSVGTFDIAARKAEHWCWHRPQASPAPAVRAAAWCRSDLDRFVLSRLETAGLTPAPEASLEALVRRASEILAGLPPLPEDLARVTTDSDPLAYEKYVDQVLASPHYGERFARHWLDVARYGETRGHEFDHPIPNAWRYRDWVIRALNADLPYDQFVREQIAGDLIAAPRLDPQGANESVIGTGFWLLGEEVHSPVDIRQDEADRVDNRIDTFGKAFLGQALGCARCHDHKFDAISDEDYYAIAGMVLSSSYRQVPFESLEHNRKVAARLAEMDRAACGTLLRRLEAITGITADAATPASLTAAALVRPKEQVLADYTTAGKSTPLICDAAAWQTVAVGQPVVTIAADTSQPSIQVEPLGHARSDAIWSQSRSSGEREPGSLGTIDRAGRVLRTPKARLTEGVLWHRVRGKLQIVAVVDGHVMVAGPLYGTHVMTVDTQSTWQWVRQDLRRDIKDWHSGHVVHVEYAAIEGAAGVAAAVSALDQPMRDNPDWPTRMNAALSAIDWTAEAATPLRDEAKRYATERTAILASARLSSATAPALLDGNGIDQFVLLKGSAARPGPLAPRRFLEAIDGPHQPAWPEHSSGRRELADRVLDAANPLTSRVIVNRIWHHLFGRGLIPTTDNFGKLGEAAADPQAQALVDTLAVRFRDEGWSIKRLVREIVTSSTWRMSSVPSARAAQLDPLNLLLHHYPLRRLEGEAVRDKILAVSGRLDRTVGGPSIEVSLSEFHEGRGRPKPGPLDGAGRRSLYTKIRRNFLPSFLLAFDLPVPFQAMGRRNVTNVPAQALTLMNDPFVGEQAAAWADRMLGDSSLSPTQRIDQMYRAAFARPPTADEQAAALTFLAEQAARHGGDFTVDPRHGPAWADLAHALINAKEFIFVP